MITVNSGKKITYYEFFKIKPDATQDEIKTAYKVMCRIHHPDMHKLAENKARAERNFKVVQEAYAIFRDPTKKNHYDVMNGLIKRRRKQYTTYRPTTTSSATYNWNNETIDFDEDIIFKKNYSRDLLRRYKV